MIFQLERAKINYRDQGTVYLEEPSQPPKAVVIAVHGSGRNALDYRDTPFYRQQRDIVLENGCVFAALSNRYDTWGTDDGLYNLNLLVDLLRQRYCVEKIALWATSAGGVLANRMVRCYPEKISLVIGTFPVYDLAAEFHLVTCKRGWHTEDQEEFLRLIAGKNPAEFPAALQNHPYYITHGTADVAVPIAENAYKMLRDVGQNVTLQVIEGGVHSTENFAFYGSAVAQAMEALTK
jgi:alpha-beta hydrolase superfamily lysophospholipase